MEKELRQIAEGRKRKEDVLKECLREMRKIFKKVRHSVEQMRDFLEEQSVNNTPE